MAGRREHPRPQSLLSTHPFPALTRRFRQHPPRRAVDRFMKLERHHCRPHLAPAAVPELGRWAAQDLQ